MAWSFFGIVASEEGLTKLLFWWWGGFKGHESWRNENLKCESNHIGTKKQDRVRLVSKCCRFMVTKYIVHTAIGFDDHHAPWSHFPFILLNHCWRHGESTQPFFHPGGFGKTRGIRQSLQITSRQEKVAPLSENPHLGTNRICGMTRFFRKNKTECFLSAYKYTYIYIYIYKYVYIHKNTPHTYHLQSMLNFPKQIYLKNHVASMGMARL